MNDEIKIGNTMYIFNGGNPLPGCPESWEQAREIETKFNANTVDGFEWKFDCGFKLDFDANIIKISSRFYPPRNHYGPKWDGTVSLMFFDDCIVDKNFECESIYDLKKEVEMYVKSLLAQIKEK